MVLLYDCIQEETLLSNSPCHRQIDLDLDQDFSGCTASRTQFLNFLLKWLTDWKNEAADRDVKIRFTYAKVWTPLSRSLESCLMDAVALRSIKKYPLTLKSGLECKILEGFGDKICSQIDEKLNSEFAKSSFQSVEDFIKSFDKPKVNMHNSNGRNISKQPSASKRGDDQCIAIGQNEYNNHTITNIRDADDDGDGCDNNDNIICIDDEADDDIYCNESGEMSKNHQFTGLLEKELDNCVSAFKESSSTKPPTLASFITSSCSTTIPTATTTNPSTSSTVLSTSSDTFRFMYVMDDGKETCKKDQAVIDIDDGTSVVKFLIKCKYTDLLLSGKEYSLDYTSSNCIEILNNPKLYRSCDDIEYIYAYLNDEHAPDYSINNSQLVPISSTPTTLAASSTTTTMPSSLTSTSCNNNMDSLFQRPIVSDCTFTATTLTASTFRRSKLKSAHYRPTSPTTSSATASMTSSTTLTPSANSNENKKFNKTKSENLDSKHKKLKHDFLKCNEFNQPMQQRQQHVTLTPLHRQHSATLTDDIINDNINNSNNDNKTNILISSSTADVTFSSGSFDVLLCVDCRESMGPASLADDVLMKELIKNNVQHDVRQLHLGDFLWVARCRDSGMELVLDWIVERKRMDDLGGSIIDGRFREQKFRLSNCGLKHVIYLIEEQGKQHSSLPEATLNQAIINTQVVDEFFVKRVKHARESATYLTLVTRYLQSLYSTNKLYGFNQFFKVEQTCTSPSVLSSSSSISPPNFFLMTYSAFSEQSKKSKCLTVGRTFLKQLTQINGLTTEKAISVINMHPTPLSLFNAYDACPDDASRLEMLTNLKCGPSRRNFGSSLSRSVALMFYLQPHLQN
ncbi:hypothetical protein HELRODRAFT_189672 [Helobdella robusta]|uniref:Crossover junction endonuclease MUS81 n=1 Tax=Helobdella robusta TaxID=6412 RepID=T1FR89_HELRO|nr:hypothetical protein HELRODRAFT_189672 [Helobdella robusta]ESN93079.1 hypothetical protein HELRODRAFT_189672 [Helobdella robusta]